MVCIADKSSNIKFLIIRQTKLQSIKYLNKSQLMAQYCRCYSVLNRGLQMSWSGFGANFRFTAGFIVIGGFLNIAIDSLKRVPERAF
jgi:hypothetical protein